MAVVTGDAQERDGRSQERGSPGPSGPGHGPRARPWDLLRGATAGSAAPAAAAPGEALRPPMPLRAKAPPWGRAGQSRAGPGGSAARRRGGAAAGRQRGGSRAAPGRQ